MPNRRGQQLREGLDALAGRYSFIREVRGLGLMIGVEIQSERATPTRIRDRLIEMAFHRGLLLLPCGPSTVRFCPPLCLTTRQVEIGLEILAATMEAAAEQMQNREKQSLSKRSKDARGTRP